MNLSGVRVAFLVTDGYEDSELTSPWQAVSDAGAEPVLVSPKPERVEGKNGHTQPVDHSAYDASAYAFDALVLPGGVVNADHLRTDNASQRFTRAFVNQHKPVAVICHGAWILTEVDAVDGHTMTSYPSLRTDLENAGATWVDREVVVDNGLISSRTPKDLPAFNARLLEEVSEWSLSPLPEASVHKEAG